ncbi:MAG: radical SAM protein [Phaeodactylibacter sp.]|nr:radical SAM protein [Phaeodactylibacter sp.]MCB9265831.1 radical SAM protein [Lewinellaceae bacterium]MCB9288831.1 radical SAM protein [Lewinellaceae bacterium]
MISNLKTYLADPFLNRLYQAVRKAGPARSISLDLTHVCNLRCTGCYYFEEGMDRHQSPKEEAVFDAFIEREKERGTNFITIVGGEPSLALGRLKKAYDNFKISVATNGIRKIPFEGFEHLPIGISVWGSHDTDRRLRGSGKADVFDKALKNYKDDPRAFWYYTVAPGLSDEIERVVEQCIDNGNYVLFNYYSDLSNQGGALDNRIGFEKVRREIDRMIECYPEKILMTSHFNRVVSSGRLFDEHWGYEVCTNLSTNQDINRQRLQNGNPYNPHFRAYNADFTTTRRCCTGVGRDCGSCFDTWEHFSWIMINMRRHLGSKQDFTNWLATMYLFYLINRLVDFEDGIALLPEIHKRIAR